MATNQYGQPVGNPVAGWTARPRPPHTPMQGRWCRVEKLDPARHGPDIAAAHAVAPDGRDWTYMAVERPADAAAFAAFLERIAASEDPLHHAILDAATGKAVGTAASMRIDPANGAIEVGFITYSPLLKQTPAGTEAMYLLMRRAFDELGYRRYEWKCDSLNAASRRAALRYGFRFEGIFPQAVVYKGRSRDTAWYSVTDREWPAVRQTFERWLAPENFDGEGRQRRLLTDLRDATDRSKIESG